MTDGPGDDRLETWQQIADYLKVSPRTAQAWAVEKGLPVHRLKGEKTPVFAKCSELNAWVRSREVPIVANNGAADISAPAVKVPCQPAPAEPAATRRWNPSRSAMFGSAAALICLIGTAVALRHSGSRQAAVLRAEGPVLVAQDAAGREMWRHTFERGLWRGNYTAAAIADKYWIGDLDGDGHAEVLFRYDSAGLPGESSSVFCFSEAGRVRWTFQVGRTMRDSGGAIYPPYRIAAMLALGARGDMYSRVVVSSTHPLDQACQLAFLDANGRLLGEYWHPGHLFWLSADHAVPGGAPRLLAAGVNNGEHRATLVALDPMAVAGASTPWRMRDQRFRLLDMPEAREDTVILFPRTCLSRDEPYTRVGNLEVDDHVIRATVLESYDPASRRTVVYEFDQGLHLRRAFLSSNYIEEHLKLEHAGALKHSWREDEAILSQGLECRHSKP